MKNFSRLAMILSIVLLLYACGTFPKNTALNQYDAAKGYRYGNLKAVGNNTDSLFVVLAFSGGGTRAASFAYGVLQELNEIQIEWKGRKKRLLDEVDIISSVSGGSFTGAYYALYRDKLFDGAFERELLKKDIEKALLSAALSPANWPKLAGSSFGRSDLAAEYYHQNIFGKATFQDLIDQGTRPFLMINATDMTTAAQFPFIQDQFDLICSDLADLPVARAVASSSAFPGLLTPLTFQSYAGSCQYRTPPWVKLAEEDRRTAPERANLAEDRLSYYQTPAWGVKRDYVHLIDGGVADNIGLRSLIFALESTDPAYSIQRQVDLEIIEKLVIIVVNAATDPESKRDKTAKVPGLIDVLTSAAVIPLGNYSFDTVNRARTIVQEYNEGVLMRNACEKVLKKACPDAKLPGGDLYSVDVYLSQVAFDFITDPKIRYQFKNLPTTFALPAKTVDALKQMGRELLQNDPQIRRLLQELHGGR